MDETTREKLISRIVVVSLIVAALLAAIFKDATIFTKTVLWLIAFVIFLHSFYPVEPNHYGERRLFGWRAPVRWRLFWLIPIPPLIKKGWGLWVPFAGTVYPFPVLKQSAGGKAKYTAKDDSQQEMPWHMEFYIDPSITDKKGRVKFLGISEETFKKISDRIGSKLDKVCGTKDRETAKLRLKELDDYVRVALLLPKELWPEELNNLVDKDDQLLDWIRDDRLLLKDLFKKKERLGLISEFEYDFGIRVTNLYLEMAEPTPETARKIEEKEQQQVLAEAAESQINLAKRFAGIPKENTTMPIPHDALVAAQRALNVIKSSQSIEFGGLGQGGSTAPVIPIVIQPTPTRSHQDSNRDKDKKGGRK